MLTLGLVLGLVFPKPAQGQPSTPGAERLSEGRKAYEDLDLEGALDALKAGLASPALSDQERAEGELWLGFVRYEGGRPDLARAAFARALKLRPDLQVPAGLSPKLAAIVESMRPDKAVASTPDILTPSEVITEGPSRSRRELTDKERAAGVIAAGTDRGATRIESEAVVALTEPAPDEALSPWVWVGLGAAAIVVGGIVAGVLLSQDGEGACGPMGGEGGCVVFTIR